MTIFYKHLFLACFLLLCCILKPEDSTKENALGGYFTRHGRLFGPEEPEHNLERGDYPFLVMIQMIIGYQKERVCSGSLVAPKAVLTSSLCLEDHHTVAFWAGNVRYTAKEDYDWPTQGRELEHYEHFDEMFGNSTLAYAVTVLPFLYTEYVKPVGLYRKEIQLPLLWRDYCYVLGLGEASPVVDDSRVARFMVQYIWSRVGCRAFPPPQPYMCSPHDCYNQTICKGDIGGPVMCPASPGKLQQFGIVDGRISEPEEQSGRVRRAIGIMDLNCVVPQLENRYLFVGYFHAFVKQIPDLPTEDIYYPPLNRTAYRHDGPTQKPKGSGTRWLKVSVLTLSAAITSSVLVTVKIT